MKVIIDGVEYECRAAHKGVDYVRLFLGTYAPDGTEDTATFMGIDPTVIVVDGGSISTDAISPAERLDALEAAVMELAILQAGVM